MFYITAYRAQGHKLHALALASNSVWALGIYIFIVQQV